MYNTTSNNLCNTKITLPQNKKTFKNTLTTTQQHTQTYNKSSNAKSLQLDFAFYSQSKGLDGTLPYSKDQAGGTWKSQATQCHQFLHLGKVQSKLLPYLVTLTSLRHLPKTTFPNVWKAAQSWRSISDWVKPPRVVPQIHLVT